MHDEGFFVVARLHRIAEDATLRFLGGGDVGVAPGSPEIVHAKGRVADGRHGVKLGTPEHSLRSLDSRGGCPHMHLTCDLQHSRNMREILV
jgi:hypothetical protein